MARGERLSQQGQIRSAVSERAADTPVAGQRADSGWRPLIVATAIVVLVMGLLSVAAAGWVLAQYGQDSPPEDDSPRIEQRPGDHVDGQLAFRIDETRCGVPAVGVDSSRFNAVGQYCVYLVRVRNVGSQPRVLLSNAQRGVGSDGKSYVPQRGPSEAAGTGNNGFPALLWSDQEITVALVYDLDPAVSVVSLELHDSPWSDGVSVQV